MKGRRLVPMETKLLHENLLVMVILLEIKVGKIHSEVSSHIKISLKGHKNVE